MSAPVARAKARKQTQPGQKSVKSAANQRWFRHVNIHSSTLAAAGVMQTFPNNANRSITANPTTQDLEQTDDSSQATGLDGVQQLALEKVKDLVVNLDWEEMQDLVAGILRAMGYKTQISPPGPDRGRDIVASPDGFGFEHPRIVVEVKHRTGQVDSRSIRGFIGGRHPDDRGLYVSTGGFTRDAKYEADRSTVPLTLWDIDTLVRTLIEHYEHTDSETKRLVPLKKIYIPA